MTTANSDPDARVAKVWEALHEVVDPELGIDIVDLGLVYDVTVDAAGCVRITMTLTTPGCPVAESLPCEAETVVSWALGPSVPVAVEVVWDPPWTPEQMSGTATASLGYRQRRT